MAALEQVYATGSVPAFAGATGLLQTILPLVCGTDVAAEVIDGTPNGILLAFSGGLSNFPCGKGRLTVSYTIGGNVYEATDNGSGVLTGTSAAGTIVYSTGAWTMTFTSAPDNGTDLTADYLYGAPGADWQLKVQEHAHDNANAEPWGAALQQCILHNTGLSGAETILIGIREWKYAAGNGYGWDLNGYTTYTPAQLWNASGAQHLLTAYSTTWNRFTNHPMLPLVDGTIYYWLYSNRQRIVLFVKVQSNYESMYLGFGRRFGSPAEYPAPLVVKGSSQGLVNYSDVSAFRQFIAGNRWEAEGYSLLVLDPGEAFAVCGGTGFASGVKVEPHTIFDTAPGTIAPTKDTSRILRTPVYLTRPSTAQCLMDLDGVNHLAGTGIQSEDTMTAGGHRWRIFQNIHRTSAHEFCAVEEQTTSTTSSSTSSTTSTTN